MDARRMNRRRFIQKTALAAGWVLFSHLAPRNSWGQPPVCDAMRGQPLRWIVPFSPGGGYDTYSRLIAPYLAAKLGTTISVENVSGAGGSIGTLRIKNARPDGRTLGLINAPGLLTTALAGSAQTPNPIEDLTILGRVVRSRTVWAVKTGAAISGMEDFFRVAEQRPLLCASTEAGSTNFVGVAVASAVLGLQVEHLAGFPGTRQTTLALIRGEVDFVSHTFESALDRIESGDLKVVMQISDRPISDHPSLQGVPLLGGASGVAARRAELSGRDPAQYVTQIKALVSLIEAGRLVVAPAGLPAAVEECLGEGLYAALTDPKFEQQAAQARRTLDVARAAEARAVLAVTAANAEAFAAIVRRAIAKMRQ